ncbi:toprim domain-containing protein [Desulfopila sp. IMCC35008]|uniref:toprim domain-containing protein n=1 Tax=Desulfopila sp. IMCC35008 TaxID=2653858 RepID=UPI0013D83B8A|nr:toprim domain-containing protein [Desulfopila sp. IMCC35008]
MTPRELHRLLEGNIVAVVQHLLPAGKRRGREWVIGSVAGEEGSSLAIHLEGDKTGVWSDFATGDKGDLFDLWGSVRGVSFQDALAEIKNYLGVDDPPQFKQPKYKLPEKPKCTKPNAKMLEWWKDCGISEVTVAKLRIGQRGNAIVFPYINPNGVLELVKYRDMDEKKFWSNEAPCPCLFSWQAVGDNHRDIVICEGEKDCLTFWEQGIPALSVPKGAGSGGKHDWIEYEHDRLERFDQIYICMDSDKAGQEAVIEILDRLGRHRCKVVKLECCGVTYKDPNEAHQDGVLLQTFLDAASTVDPEELRLLSDFHDDILDELDPNKNTESGLRLPWQKSFDSVRLRPAEVSVWGGINGHGKSELLGQVMLDGVYQSTKWCVASLEMPANKLGARIYRQAGCVSNPTPEYATKIKQLIDNNIFIFNAYGTAKSSRILEVFEYARRRYGVTHFILDSLSKAGFRDDDYPSQKSYVDELFEYALQHKVHVALVVHMRKGETEEKPPGKFDLKGSGGIADMVSSVFIVWRNKRKERLLRGGDEAKIEKAKQEADTLLICTKQRENGKEPSFGLWFHPQSCQFLERQSAEPKRYIHQEV